MNQFETVLTRSEVKGNTLTGHAIVYDQVAQVGKDSYEVIDRHAFDNVFSDPNLDVRAFYNHDHNLLLGRQSSGTLHLRSDNVGVHFDLDIPDTSYGNDLRALVERGDLNAASFGFTPKRVDRGRLEDGSTVVRHLEIDKFVEISVVAFPAYTSTHVELRAVKFDQDLIDARTTLIKSRGKILLKSFNRKSGVGNE